MFFHIVVTFFQAYNCVGKGGVLDGSNTDYGYPEGPILERDCVTMESLFESDANSLKNTFSDEFKSFSFLSDSHNLVKSYLLDELIQKEKVVNIDSVPSQIHDVLFLETGLKLSVLAVKDTDVFELVAII